MALQMETRLPMTSWISQSKCFLSLGGKGDLMVHHSHHNGPNSAWIGQPVAIFMFYRRDNIFRQIFDAARKCGVYADYQNVQGG